MAINEPVIEVAESDKLRLILVESNVTVEDTCGGCDTNEVYAHCILEQRCEVLRGAFQIRIVG